MDTLFRMVPYTRDTYLRFFDAYNHEIWPLQIVAYGACLLALWWSVRPFRRSDRITAGLLTLAWLWTGVVFHVLHLSRMDWAAWALGLLFVLQGLMILTTGVLRRRLAFRFTGGVAGWAGALMIAFALIGYPAAAIAMGQGLSTAAFVGVAPAPTILLTLGLLLLTRRRTPWHLLVLPILLACLEGGRALVLDLPQDLVLPVAALLTVGLAIRKNRLTRRSME